MAFQTRSDLEKCHKENKDGWDEDEIYFVVDELRKASDKGYCKKQVKTYIFRQLIDGVKFFL